MSWFSQLTFSLSSVPYASLASFLPTAPWLCLLLAGFFEIVWAYYLKQSHGMTRLVPTLITLAGMVLSFGLLAQAMKTIPLGTAYTLWTGIGAVGAFAVGVLFLGEHLTLTRLAAAALIVAGLVLMKLSAPTI